MRRGIISIALVMWALPAAAQIGRSRPVYGAEPKYWVGLSYGYVDGMTVTDESTDGTWRYSYTSQLRATLEKTLQRGVTIGASAGFSTANLQYTSPSLSTPCGLSCNAKGDITQYLAFLHLGRGSTVGFYGMYNVEAGITRFANFRERESGTALPPSSASNDFTFGFGGGFGYGFSPTTSIYLNPQYDIILHPQSTTRGSGSAPRMLIYRLGFRMGF